MEELLQDLPVNRLSSIRMMASSLIQLASESLLTATRLSHLAARDGRAESAADLWEDGVWKTIDTMRESLDNLPQAVLRMAGETTSSLLKTDLEDILLVPKEEPTDEIDIVALHDVLLASIGEVGLQELCDYRNRDPKEPNWKSHSTNESENTNRLCRYSTKLDNPIKGRHMNFNLDKSDVSNPFSLYSLELIRKENEELAPPIRWHHEKTPPTKDLSVALPSDMTPLLQEDRKTPDNDNSIKLSIAYPSESIARSNSQISYLTSCSRFVQNLPFGTGKLREGHNSMVKSSMFYKSSQDDSRKYSKFYLTQDTDLSSFKGAIVTEISLEQNKTDADHALYLFDGQKELKVFKVLESQLSLVHTGNLEGWDILALIKQTDKILLKKKESGMEFSLLDPFTGVILPTTSPFDTESQLVGLENLQPVSLYNMESGLILSNSTGQVFLLALQDLRITLLVKDFWLSKKPEFKKIVASSDGKILLGTLSNSDAGSFIVHDYRDSQKFTKIVNFSHLLEKYHNLQGDDTKADQPVGERVVDFEFLDESSCLKDHLKGYQFVAVSRSKKGYTAYLLMISSNCDLEIISHCEAGFPADTICKFKKSSHQNRFSLYSLDKVVFLEVKESRMELINQATDSKGVDILGVFFAEEAYFLVHSNGISKIGELKELHHQSRRTLSLSPPTEDSITSNHKSEACWWDIQTDRENMDPQVALISDKIKKYQKPKEKLIPQASESDREQILTFGDGGRKIESKRLSSNRGLQSLCDANMNFEEKDNSKRNTIHDDRPTRATERLSAAEVFKEIQQPLETPREKVTFEKTKFVAKEQTNGKLFKIYWDKYREIVYFGGEKLNLLKHTDGKAKISTKSFNLNFSGLKITPFGLSYVLLHDSKEVLVLDDKFKLKTTLKVVENRGVNEGSCICDSTSNLFFWQVHQRKFAIGDCTTSSIQEKDFDEFEQLGIPSFGLLTTKNEIMSIWIKSSDQKVEQFLLFEESSGKTHTWNASICFKNLFKIGNLVELAPRRFFASAIRANDFKLVFMIFDLVMTEDDTLIPKIQSAKTLSSKLGQCTKAVALNCDTIVASTRHSFLFMSVSQATASLDLLGTTDNCLDSKGGQIVIDDFTIDDKYIYYLANDSGIFIKGYQIEH